MKQVCSNKVVCSLAIALILAVSVCLMSPFPVAAQSVQDYFQISYEPVSFRQDENQSGKLFYAIIRGQATCTRNLPLSVAEARITSRVIGEHAVSGTTVILNSSYTVAIKPFPSKKGETIAIDQAVPLQFPDQAETGSYHIIGELVNAEVKVLFGWFDVAEYLPQANDMGSLEYAPLTPKPTPTDTPASVPASTPEAEATPAPESPEPGIAWWVWPVVVLAFAGLVAMTVWRLRRRSG